MGGLGEGRIVACACFLAAYMVTFVAVGSLDNAFDAVIAANDIARHDAEWALSATFELFAIVGLASLWPLRVATWYGGAAVGLLAASAAGGFHVVSHVATWLSAALVVGFAGGFALFAVGKRRPGACALFGVEVALAALQVAFIAQNT